MAKPKKGKGKTKRKIPPKKRTPLRPAHRPTLYDPEYHPAWAYKFALMGCIGTEIAKQFGIAESTHELWKTKHPEYSEAIRDGGDKADAEVAERLKNRAMGYVAKVQQAFKVKVGKDMERVEIVTLEQETPPDTKAATIWLSNRQRHKWKERHTVDVEASDDVIAMMQEARRRANLEPDD